MAGLFDWLIEKGLATKFPQETWSQQPTNRRVFLESVLGGDRSPITEKNLTQEEIDYLSQKWKDKVKYAIKDRTYDYNYAKHKLDSDKTITPAQRQSYEDLVYAFDQAKNGRYTKEWLDINKNGTPLEKSGIRYSTSREFNHGYLADPNFSYEDYKTPSGMYDSRRTADMGKTPAEAMETLLGKYRVYMNRQGQPMIMDNYDFNPSKFGATGAGEFTAGSAGDATEIGDTSTLYDMIRQYAGGKMPPGQGRPVSIKLKDIYNK